MSSGTTNARLAVTWHARAAPLAPVVGVAAQNEAARALADRLLARSEAHLAALTGVAGPNLLVLLLPLEQTETRSENGDDGLLPWADGAVYLARDAAAPSLLVPATRAPSVPPDLLERALRAGRWGDSAAAAPFAMLPGDGETALVVPLAGARPVERERLRAWQQAQAATGEATP